MKIIKVDIALEDNEDTRYFITQMLPKLREEYKMKVSYSRWEVP